MTEGKETLKEERQIAQKIAKDFSSKYLAPDKNEITTITIYQEPVVSNDVTMLVMVCQLLKSFV
ncbi:TPA: hypothetical protein ACGO91_001339 [Streptococcus suis]